MNGENFHYTGRSYDTCKREVQNKKITITSSCWFVTNTCPSFWSKLLTPVKKGERKQQQQKQPLLFTIRDGGGGSDHCQIESLTLLVANRHGFSNVILLAVRTKCYSSAQQIFYVLLVNSFWLTLMNTDFVEKYISG